VPSLLVQPADCVIWCNDNPFAARVAGMNNHTVATAVAIDSRILVMVESVRSFMSWPVLCPIYPS